MNEAEIKERAFAMRLTSPAFPPGPYRFIDREFLPVLHRQPRMVHAVAPGTGNRSTAHAMPESQIIVMEKESS